MTLADHLTLFRIPGSVPAIWLFLILKFPGKYRALENDWPFIVIFAAFCLFELTDWLDGMLARKYGKTRFGAFLDPMADKIFLWSYSAAFVFSVAWNAVAVLALIFICDIISTLERAFGYKRSEKAMEANVMGKCKTVCHSATILFFLLTLVFYPESASSAAAFWSVWVSSLGWILLWPTLVCALCSVMNKAERWKS